MICPDYTESFEDPDVRTVTSSGFCPSPRTDAGITLSELTVARPTRGFNALNVTYASAPFCLSVTGSLEDNNPNSLLYFYEDLTGLPTGQLTINPGSIAITIQGAEVTFSQATPINIPFRYQLCFDGTSMTLWRDCQQIGSQSYSLGGGFTGSGGMTFLAATVGPGPTFFDVSIL